MDTEKKNLAIYINLIYETIPRTKDIQNILLSANTEAVVHRCSSKQVL